MNTDQSFPQAFLDEHGEPWSPNPAELDDEYSVAYLADGLRRQLTELFRSEEIRAKAPKVQVQAAILPWADVKVFIWRARPRPYEFVLAMNIGTFEKFTELLSSAQLWEPLMPRLKYLSRLVEADFRRLAVYMTVYAIACHEFAHIFRGHLDFMDSLPRTDPSRLLEGRKLCEVDADKWGSFVLAGKVQMQASGISQQMRGSQAARDDIALEILTMLGAGLYRCNSLYNQVGTKPLSFYPHPFLRVANVTIGAADNLSPANRFDQIRQRLVSVLVGMARAEEFATKSAELPQKAWDVATELIAFEKEFRARLEAFSVELAPFSPARY
jgi:hypothetical protein